METIKKAIEKEKHSLFEKIVIKSLFKKNCKQVVVWTNEEARLDVDKNAGEFREGIVYIDHFNEWLRQMEKKTRGGILCKAKEKILYSLKDFFKGECKQRSKKLVYDCKNYLKLYSDLDDFRNERAKEEKTEHYKIFKNEDMINLIEKRPKSKGGLQSMKFSYEWITKYGEEVLEILNKDV